MSNFNNVLGGHKAKNAGRAFESDLMRQAINEGIGFEQIPSGCEWRKTYRGLRPIPVKTPFDFMMFKNGKAIFFDAKSTELKTFPYGKLDRHQVLSLCRIAKHGFKCGYLVKFVNIGFVWFDVEKLFKLKPRESLRPEDGVSLVTPAGSFSLISLFL